jgi:epoxyqueuosine reductase
MKEQVRTWVEGALASSPWNRLPPAYGGGVIFGAPRVGVARGDDAIFERFKAVGAPELATPAELWRQSGLPRERGLPARLRVVSIVFPYSAAIRQAGARSTKLPPEIYTVGRNWANSLIDSVLEGVERFFRERGFRAVSGVRSPTYEIFVGGEPYRAVSTWSERHVAFAAGLGTFSLQRALITEVGCNVRLGSVVTDAPLAQTARGGDDAFANCPYLAGGTCGDCIGRCPAGAITEAGHDKQTCRRYVHAVGQEIQGGPAGALLVGQRQLVNGEETTRYSTGCALCQFGVLCTDRNPVAQDRAGTAPPLPYRSAP